MTLQPLEDKNSCIMTLKQIELGTSLSKEKYLRSKGSGDNNSRLEDELPKSKA